MIPVERGPAPAFFSSADYATLTKEVVAHFEDYNSAKRQVRYRFEQVQQMYKHAKPVLLERFAGKCAYCESAIDESSISIIDHFRPRVGARGYHQQFENHYWWLMLEWNNLLIACPECNNSKAAWFPLVDETHRAVPPGHSGPTIADEQPLLIDPCADDPALHLVYDPATGYAQALSERGSDTIEILQLNRSTLVEARQQQFAYLEQLFQNIKRGGARLAALNELYKAGHAATPFAAIQRQFLRERAADLPALQRLAKSAKKEVRNALPAVVKFFQDLADDLLPASAVKVLAIAQGIQQPDEHKLDRLTIERIELHNFKNITDLCLDVPLVASRQGNAPWILFLGENAVGKSSIMQAVVLTLMGAEVRKKMSSLKPEDVLHYSWVDGKLKQADEGWVKIKVCGLEEPLLLTFQKGATEFTSSGPTPRTYLIAYGSTRLLPDEDNAAYENMDRERVRVRHLFKAATPLIDAEEWLYQQYEHHPVTFDIIVRGLRDMLLMQEGDTIAPDADNPAKRRILVNFKSRQQISPVSHLSDGYRTVLALACDMMSMLVHDGSSMETVEGIVVIDELESNLHPRWKKRIIGCFRKVFPRIQFIVSTHDPLCLRGLYKNEIILLRQTWDQKVTAITDLPDPRDLQVDQLLASEFFGLNTTLDTDLEDIYDEYYNLLLVDKPSEEQQARIAQLKQQLQQRQHLGNGLRDELMFEVIDKLLAHERYNPRPRTRTALKAEVLKQVIKSWEAVGLVPISEKLQ